MTHQENPKIVLNKRKRSYQSYMILLGQPTSTNSTTHAFNISCQVAFIFRIHPVIPGISLMPLQTKPRISPAYRCRREKNEKQNPSSTPPQGLHHLHMSLLEALFSLLSESANTVGGRNQPPFSLPSVPLLTVLEIEPHRPLADTGLGPSSCGMARKPPNPLPTMTDLRASPPKPPRAHCGPKPCAAV